MSLPFFAHLEQNMKGAGVKSSDINLPSKDYQKLIVDVVLTNGPPWGFAIGGGREFGSKLVINKITEKGSAADSGLLREDDEILSVNGENCFSRSEAIRLIKATDHSLKLRVSRKQPTNESNKFKLEKYDKQGHNHYETVYGEMLDNLDTLNTSYSERKNYIREGDSTLQTDTSDDRGSCSSTRQRNGTDTHRVIHMNSKENISPNRFVAVGNKEISLNIDVRTGELWAKNDGQQNALGVPTQESETSPRGPSPVGVKKVRVKSVNVPAVYPKSRDGIFQSSVTSGHVRSASAEVEGHSKSQDEGRTGRPLPRSSASVDRMSPPAFTATSHGVSKSRRQSNDRESGEDSGVENTSNMNVRKAKAMFEEISRSTENLLEIGKPPPSHNKQRNSPRQNLSDRKEFTYSEANNNAPMKPPAPVDKGQSRGAEIRNPLVDRVASVIPYHAHSRSLPVEYEERQERSVAPQPRRQDSYQRPKSAHYLADDQCPDRVPARRVSPEARYNQAQLMRSFRVSKSHGRYGAMEPLSGYEGDEENESGSEKRKYSSIRHSTEDLRLLPTVAGAGLVPHRTQGDAIPRSSTLPANEMREATKKYYDQLFKAQSSSHRYSLGQPVEHPPRLARSSSFGSRSRSESAASTEDNAAAGELVTNLDTNVTVLGNKTAMADHVTTIDQHLSREDQSNSILSRLLREHNANSGVALSKIDEEAQGNRGYGRKLYRLDQKQSNLRGPSEGIAKGGEPNSSMVLLSRGTGVKTVAVSSTSPSAYTVTSGTGERGSEYVQGITESTSPQEQNEIESRQRRYQLDRSIDSVPPPRVEDFASSAARVQANHRQTGPVRQQTMPMPIGRQQNEPLILKLDRSPKSDRRGFGYYRGSPEQGAVVPVDEVQKPLKPETESKEVTCDNVTDDLVTISHDKEPSTDSVKELREINESVMTDQDNPSDNAFYDSQTPDLDALPPPPDELLAESPPEKEKPQRTINRKKRDMQTLQSSSRNSSCVSTDSTTSTATADSGIGMRPFRSTDSSPRTSPLADNHSGYDYRGEEVRDFKGSQEMSDEDEGMPAEPPDATSTPERIDTSLDVLTVDTTVDQSRRLSPSITDTPGSSAPNSRPGSASFLTPRFEELDSEKSKLIESMRDKIRELKQQEDEIGEEITSNEELGKRVRSMVETKATQTEFSKYELFIGELNKIVALLLSLTQRLHRYELMLQDLDMSEEEDKHKRDELIRKIEKLRSQHEEACYLRDVNDKRGENVANFLEKYCTEEEYADFQYYVDMKSQLALMQSEIKEKVKLGEERLKALECTGVEWTCGD